MIPKTSSARSACAPRVDYTVVNGCITVAHGKLTGIDEAKTAENARHVCDRYLGKN